MCAKNLRNALAKVSLSDKYLVVQTFYFTAELFCLTLKEKIFITKISVEFLHNHCVSIRHST